MRNCVRVAQQTLTLYVWVRILVPQPKIGKIQQNLAGFYLLHIYGFFVADASQNDRESEKPLSLRGGHESDVAIRFPLS